MKTRTRPKAPDAQLERRPALAPGEIDSRSLAALAASLSAKEVEKAQRTPAGRKFLARLGIPLERRKPSPDLRTLQIRAAALRRKGRRG